MTPALFQRLCPWAAHLSQQVLFLVAVFLPLAFGGEAHAARVALVIGNQNYAKLEPLQKALGDAVTYAELFEARGFDRVILRQDLTRQEMDMAVAEFVEAIRPGDTAVFVYSGHGWSDGTQNYLVGTDAPLEGSQEFLRRISLPIQNGANGIIDEMQAHGANLKVAIIDACRDNPFVAQNGTRSTGFEKGLNRLTEPPPEGTFLVFSAGAGQVALDRLAEDDSSPNGVFTRTLVPLLQQNLTLLDATKATQETVFELASSVGYRQQPSFYDETRGNRACLWESCEGGNTAAVAADELTWLAIAGSTNAADFESFLRLFPNSGHRAEAAARIEELGGGPSGETTVDLENGNSDDGHALTANVAPPIEQLVPASAIDYPLLVQTELQRLGCYADRLDGNWGPRSREALVLFSAQAGLNLGGRRPDGEILSVLRGKSGIICTQRTPTQQAATGDAAPTRSVGCYTVSVTVDGRKANGNVWDVGSAESSSPDPQIAESSTGSTGMCKNSYSCALRVEGAGDSLSLSLIDIDLSNHDPIGTGSCSPGRSCRIGAATARVSAC